MHSHPAGRPGWGISVELSIDTSNPSSSDDQVLPATIVKQAQRPRNLRKIQPQKTNINKSKATRKVWTGKDAKGVGDEKLGIDNQDNDRIGRILDSWLIRVTDFDKAKYISSIEKLTPHAVKVRVECTV